MDENVRSILFNVLGGVIVSLVTALWVASRYRLRSYHLQRLLGFKFMPAATVRIAYGQLLLPALKDPSGKTITHPYAKAPRRGGAVPLQGTFSIEHPISECEVRAATYVATLLGVPGMLRPMLVSDIESDSLLDSSFVSFGGPGSNYKTADILASTANIFVRMSQNSFSLPSGEELPYICNRTADHGFILRVTPPEFPSRSWIVCAGIGEWGTSGSAWYLANRWRSLISQIHPWAYRAGFMCIPDFLAIIRVVPGQDQSARLEALYRECKGRTKRLK
jgi:hypothetical protein